MTRWSHSSPPRLVSPWLTSPRRHHRRFREPRRRRYRHQGRGQERSHLRSLCRARSEAAAVGSLICAALRDRRLCQLLWLRAGIIEIRGTVITAWVTVSPRKASASRLSFIVCEPKFLRCVLLAIDVIALPVFAHVALHGPEGSVWVRNGLTLGYFTDENFARFRERNNRWGCRGRVWNNDGLASKNCDDGVCRFRSIPTAFGIWLCSLVLVTLRCVGGLSTV